MAAALPHLLSGPARLRLCSTSAYAASTQTRLNRIAQANWPGEWFIALWGGTETGASETASRGAPRAAEAATHEKITTNCNGAAGA